MQEKHDRAAKLFTLATAIIPAKAGMMAVVVYANNFANRRFARFFQYPR